MQIVSSQPGIAVRHPRLASVQLVDFVVFGDFLWFSVLAQVSVFLVIYVAQVSPLFCCSSERSSIGIYVCSSEHESSIIIIKTKKI